MLAAPRRGDGGERAVSSSHTLSPGGEPQLGRPRFSSPLTTLVVVAHEGRHPMNLFPPPMVALPRRTPSKLPAPTILEGKGYSRGRCPVSRFPWMVNQINLFESLTHNGNSPESRLFSRYRCVRLDRLPSSGGIDPVRLLLRRPSCRRLRSCPSSGGIDPLRLL